MKLGLWGARADNGGLAAMTHEFWRHMRPDRTMVIDLGPAGRGEAHLDRYPEADVTRGYNDAITPEAITRWCKGLDVVYLAETSYREDFCARARELGVRTVLHAMPELWRAGDSDPDEVWVPTRWEVTRMPAGTRVVPVPVPTDRFPGIQRRRVGTFLHMQAPAFHDRNGTHDVVNALAHVEADTRVIFSGGEAPPPAVHNHYGARVEIDWRPGPTPNREDAYPGDADALLLPRRYAGLSLPMQEAASLGWPVVTTNLAPQNEWVPPETMTPPRPLRDVKMVGGTFRVYGTDPAQLGATMTRLLREPETAEKASKASNAHAMAISWLAWAPTYRRLLEEIAAG